MTGSKQEDPYERKLRMLRQLSLCCSACTCCELGRKDVDKDYVLRDPHVFSNMNPKRFMVVGQGPGWNEIIEGAPFVGASGKNFDDELAKHGLSRDDFYIANAVRCWVQDNKKPSCQHVLKCRPFLEIEVNLIRPYFVITLGAAAFETFCPNKRYNESLGKTSYSEFFDIKVFAAYHPSPLNLSDIGRRRDFAKQVQLICNIINRLKQYQSAGVSSKVEV